MSTPWSDVCTLSLPGQLVKKLRAVGRVWFALEVGLAERNEPPKDSSGNGDFDQSMKRTVYLLGVCALALSAPMRCPKHWMTPDQIVVTPTQRAENLLQVEHLTSGFVADHDFERAIAAGGTSVDEDELSLHRQQILPDSDCTLTW